MATIGHARLAANGHDIDLIEYDEGDGSGPQREIIAVSDKTGRSVLIRFPADWDLADALPEGYVVAVDRAES